MRTLFYEVKPDTKLGIEFSKGDEYWRASITAIWKWLKRKYMLIIFF